MNRTQWLPPAETNWEGFGRDLALWAGLADNGFNVNVKERTDAIELKAEMPGVKKENIDISLENGLLSISAMRGDDTTEENEVYIRRERRTGSVTRSFQLTDVLDPDSVSAELSDGILTITIKKQAKTLPKKIPVQIPVET